MPDRADYRQAAKLRFLMSTCGTDWQILVLLFFFLVLLFEAYPFLCFSTLVSPGCLASLTICLRKTANCSISNSECFLGVHCSSFLFHSSSHSNFCRVGSQLLKTEESGIEEEMVASFGNLADVNTGLNGAAGPCRKVRFSMSALFPDGNC